MGLRNNQYLSFGGGGGKFINGNVTLAVQPLKDDILIAICSLQFGLSTPTPSQPGFLVFDDANNAWVHLYDLFQPNPAGGVSAYVGQFSLSVWICMGHSGKPLNHLHVNTTPVPDAWDYQGGMGFYDWTSLFDHGVVATPGIGEIIGSTASPVYPAYQVGSNQLVMLSWFSWIGGLNGSAIPAGFTLGNSPAGPYIDAYGVRPKAGSYAPVLTAPAPSTLWVMGGVVIDITQPPLVSGTIQIPGAGGRFEMPIEE